MGNPGFFHAPLLNGIPGELGAYAGCLDGFKSSAGTRGGRVLYRRVIIKEDGYV